MPKKTNELDRWYVLLLEKTDSHLLQLLRRIRRINENRDSSDDAAREEEHSLCSEVLACTSRDDVEANTWFLPAASFFLKRPLQTPFGLARYSPVFWQVFVNPDSPIHLELEVVADSQAEEIESALDEDTPWQLGKWAFYLFGNTLWEKGSRDFFTDDEQLRLLFLEAVDSERKKFERLRQKFSGQAGQRASRRESIPEDVRIFIWRRDEGRCVKCDSQVRLEFDHIIPVSKGGSNTARNIQLLCETCNREKSDSI
jgi:hypothetical protein